MATLGIVRTTHYVLVTLLLLTGCSAVAPWERGVLSRSGMQWDLDVRETKLKEHMYSSKEAASGGTGAAGGGCGCN